MGTSFTRAIALVENYWKIVEFPGVGWRRAAGGSGALVGAELGADVEHDRRVPRSPPSPPALARKALIARATAAAATRPTVEQAARQFSVTSGTLRRNGRSVSTKALDQV